MKEMRKSKLILGTLFLTVALAAGAIGFSFAPKKDASALTSTSGAVLAGGGAELWNAADSSFNSDVLDDLVDKLFGEEDPVEYIKTNGASDYNTYGKNTSVAGEAGTPYYVVPASTINTKVGSANDGLVVKLDGKEWMAASLTLADINDEEDNVILTLYLANDLGSSQYYSNSSNVKGNNMYSRSIVRNHLLTNANWSLFNTTGEESFAEQFLVQPKYVQYQKTETSYGRANPFYGANNTLPNDAYGDVTTGWYSGINYKPADTFDGKRYDAWNEDYIWLPSATETGASNALQTSSIWRLSTNQLAHNAQSYSWLRSGLYNYYADSYYLQSTGAYGSNYVNITYGVRPALHFNLSSAALGAAGAKLKNPENTVTTYDGDTQTIGSIYAANKKAASWYAPKWYENANNYVAVSYYAASDAASILTGVKDAGEYWVKVELQQKWFDDTEAAARAYAAENGITDATEINALIERRKPQFKGDPDTSDSAHTETDRIRWFKITVNPKEISVNKPSYNASTGAFVAPSFVNEGEFFDANHPVLATRFTGTAADGTSYNAIDVLPTKRCTVPYVAQAILVNSATDKTEYKGNYVIKDASNITCQIQINRSRLAIPAVSTTSKAYTGDKVVFPISGYTTEWTDTASLVLPEGVTLEGSDAAGWSLAVSEAGKYTIRASLNADKTTDWCWNTANFQEEVVTDRTFDITVERKTLIVDFASSTGAFNLEAGQSVTFSASPNNAVDGDTVTLSLSYGLVSTGEKFPVTGGSFNASTLTPGSYYLYATLDDSAAKDNKNYVLNGGEAKRQFTVSAKNINISSVNWQYSQNNGAKADIAGGAGSSASSPFTVTYNGSAFIFEIKTADLASLGAKIDISYGSNGYQNSSQTNAATNAVGITVRIVPLDDQYAFNDEGGLPLENQYKDFTMYVQVGKAEVDFSQVKWSADELEYNAVNQTVSIVSGFPSFLTPSYNSGATGRNIGAYTAQVTGVTVSDAATAANYNIPSAAQITSNAALSHSWNIVKRRINVTWTSVQETGDDGTVIFIPALSDNSLNAVEYTYYNADKSQVMTLDEIFADYDATQLKDYWVCVRLKASGGSYNATNCVLIEGGQEVTESFNGFKAGENKTPVRVGLVTNTTVYNKAEQPAQIEFEGGNLTASDFVISYTLNGSPCGVPRYAGTYKVIISLNNNQTGEYAITGQCEFDYTIEKADYDVSNMKWVDTLNGNAEYTEAYTWAYDADSDTKGVVHTLSFVGENIDGLNVGYTADTEANLTGSNAGTYLIKVEFTVADPDNYNVPENIEFEWEIKPFAPDLSEVKWNYDTAFVYSIVDGAPVKYSVHLINLPEGLEELISYSGDTGEYSDAGSHTTTFAIDETSAMRKNFGELVFGAGLENRLVWEIKSLTIDKPQQRQTQTFRADGYTFAEITNLPEDWAQYFDVEVVDGDNITVEPVDGTWKFLDVNQYRIKIQFKQGMNTSVGGTADNVKWSDNGRAAYQVTLTVKTLVLNVKGWIDQGENVRPQLNADEVSEIEKYFDYVLVNTETGETVAINATLEWETVYTIALKLKDEFAGNVAVKYLNKEVEETTPYAFQTDVDPLADPPTNFYRKPTGDELNIAYRYTGNEIEFKLGSWFVEEKMQIMSGSVLKGTDEGTYQVRVGFKKGALSAWESNDEGEIDRAPVTITFVISSDAKPSDRFILKDIYKDNHPYKFLYANFNEVDDVEGYAYDASNPLFITRLCLGDTLAALLAQFENADIITAWTSAGVQITDLNTVLATGMTLRIMSGNEVLNQLTISVLGDINGDGKINVTDKTQLNAQLLGKRRLEAAQTLAGDINGDGKINVTDKTQLNAQLLGKRNIYDGLKLPTPRSNRAVSKVQKAVDFRQTVDAQALDFAPSEQIASAQRAPLAMTNEGEAHSPDRFSERSDALLCQSESARTVVVPSATEESKTNGKSKMIFQEFIMDKKRYVICGRKELSL